MNLFQTIGATLSAWTGSVAAAIVAGLERVVLGHRGARCLGRRAVAVVAHGAAVLDRVADRGQHHRRTLVEREADRRAVRRLAAGDRLGEANVLQALGDLYVRTARLKEAEAAYDQALSQHRAIDERRGEANVLAAMGTLALAGDAPGAFDRYLDSMSPRGSTTFTSTTPTTPPAPRRGCSSPRTRSERER